MQIGILLNSSQPGGTSGQAVGPVVATAGSIDVSTFKIGVTQTITAGTATASGGGTVTYETRHVANGVVVSTNAAYAHVAGNDGQSASAEWRAVETGGTNAGATPWQAVASGTVTYVAPMAAGAIADRSFTVDQAITPLDVAADFTGDGMTFALAPSSAALPSGLSLSSAGEITGTPTVTASEVNIVVRGTNSGGFGDTGFGVTIAGAVLSDAVTFGALTLSGEGGIAVSAADGTYGQFTVSGGIMTPNTTPLTVGETTADGVTVTVVADAATVANVTQLNAARNRSALKGKTVRIRPGDYDNSAYISDDGLTGSSARREPDLTPITFKADDPTDKPVLRRWETHPDNFSVNDLDGDGFSYRLEDLKFVNDFVAVNVTSTDWRRNDDISTDAVTMINFVNGSNALIKGCEVDGGLLPSDQGGRAHYLLTGIVLGDTCTAEDCEVYNVESCFSGNPSGAPNNTWRRCVGHDYQGDCFSINTAADGITVTECHTYSPTADTSYRHADFIQANDNTGSVDDATITFNTVSYGNVGRPVYDKVELGDARSQLVYTNNAALLAANATWVEAVGNTITLTDAEAFRDIRVVVSDATTINVVLPSCATSADRVWSVQYVTNNAQAPLRTGELSFTLNGSDTHEMGTVANLTDENLKGYSFFSTGGTEWKWQEVGRLQFDLMVRKNITLEAIHTAAKTTVSTFTSDPMMTKPTVAAANAAAVNRTVTLPAGFTDASFGIQRVFPSGGSVTVETTGAETISIDGATGVSSFTMAEGNGYQIAWNGTSWNATRDAPSLQGIFSNNTFTNSTVAGNVFLGHGSNTFWPEDETTNLNVYNNTFLAFPVAGHPKSPATAKMLLNGATAIGQRNLVQSDISQSNNSKKFGNKEYLLAEGSDMATVITDLAASTIADFRVETRADVFAACRAASGSAVDTAGQGAVGSTDTNGFFNPTTGAINAAYGAPVATDFLPLDAASYPSNGAISVTFDLLIEKGTGDVVLYNVTDGVAAQTISITDAQFSIADQVLAFTPTTALPVGKDIELRIPAGAIVSRFYNTDHAGLGVGAYGWTTTAAAQSDYETVLSTGAYLRNTGTDIFGTKTGVSKAIFAFRVDEAGAASARYDLFRIMDGSSARMRMEMVGSTGNFQGWSGGVNFNLSNPLPTTGVNPQTFLLTIDTAAATASEGVKAYLGDTEVSLGTVNSWPAGTLTFPQSEIDTVELLALASVGRFFQGAVDFVYVANPTTLPDISQQSVRDGFQYLNIVAADGSGPTGSVPELFITDLADFNAGTNRGTADNLGAAQGGTFTAQ